MMILKEYPHKRSEWAPYTWQKGPQTQKKVSIRWSMLPQPQCTTGCIWSPLWMGSPCLFWLWVQYFKSLPQISSAGEPHYSYCPWRCEVPLFLGICITDVKDGDCVSIQWPYMKQNPFEDQKTSFCPHLKVHMGFGPKHSVGFQPAMAEPAEPQLVWPGTVRS